ncbi:RAC serine/threonine-protein kinase [Fragariocoptes setiger]|uniref:non-specific serine/threonine protein kinase n=1 Tax=Fragariocoptes setiger TaxID=1670756 RepID=A0ABQ7S8P9_9ACAR|nr:RAC serine/threonine-protein kinase [Fragariocoptes setiger]
MIVREGWLLKRGEHIKNWRARYFVLKDDGAFLGFKAKPNDGNYTYPTNKFTVRGCHIHKVDTPTHFIFVIRGLRECFSENDIERNFSAGNNHDRDDWCNAIAEIALRLEANAASGVEPMSIADDSASNNTSTQSIYLQQASRLGLPTNNLTTTNINNTGAHSRRGNANKKMSLDDFLPIKLIGRGSWGKVMLSREKSTQRLYAIKVLKKQMIISQDEVGHTLTESRVLRVTNHPFLIALKYSFRDGERLCFVMEYAGGGELFYHLSQERIFTEDKTRFYAAEIVSALGYLHENEIIYRDLKLENLLLDRDGHIKIADFGLCKDNITYNDTTRTFCGTPEYLSPEVIEDNQYGRAVDWWGLGVLLYEMMCGSLPFNNRSHDLLFQEILVKQVTFPPTLTTMAKSFLNGLLIKDPAKRLGGGPDDVKEIQHHSFFLGLNWQDLVEKKIPPPFVPQVTSDTDTRYFDRQFTAEPPNLTPIDRPMDHTSEVDASYFNQFSFTAAGCSVLSQVHNLS